MMRRAAWTILIAALWPRLASAHGEIRSIPASAHDLWSAWTLDPFVVLPLALAAWLYFRGTARLWRRAGIGRGVRSWQPASFAAGLTSLLLALVWPVDALADALLAAHMVQHLLLVLVAPPLLVLGAPLAPMIRAVPFRWRRAVAAAARSRGWRVVWAALSATWMATLLHGVALWGWHLPAAFDAADRHAILHLAEHASFLGTALLFWWAVLRVGLVGGLGIGAGALCLLVTLIHSGLLGALLTLAPAPLYKLGAEGPAVWGLSRLEDQQLAGLVMWVPAGLVYLLAGVGLIAAWLQRLEGRAAPKDAAGLPIRGRLPPSHGSGSGSRAA